MKLKLTFKKLAQRWFVDIPWIGSIDDLQMVNGLMEDGGLTVFVEERMESVDFNISDIRNGLKFLMAKYQ